MSGAVRIEPLTEHVLEEVRRFQQGQLARAEDDAVRVAGGVDVAHWYLFENPEATEALPKGFVARGEAGEVVGAMQCSPQRFRCGEHEVVLLCSGGYYVDTRYRGVGLRLMRALIDTPGPVVHFASTMNEVSGAIYERYGGYPIPHTEHEMIGVMRWAPFAEEVLRRRIGRSPALRLASRIAAVLPSRIRGRGEGHLEEIERAEGVEKLRIEAPPEHAKQVTAARDARFLRWRYFEGPDDTRHLFLYRHGSGGTGLVATRIERRGHRGQIRALNVLDYWGALPEEAVVDVARQLAKRFREEADMIVVRGQPPGRQAALRRAGFMRRLLPRHIGVCIDVAGVLPTRDWYLVPADGDTSL